MVCSGSAPSKAASGIPFTRIGITGRCLSHLTAILFSLLQELTFSGRILLVKLDSCFGRRPLHDLNVLALIKGGERFVYVYDDDSRDAVIGALRDQAADPEVTLNWFDAAVLTERARHQATRSDGPMPSRI